MLKQIMAVSGVALLLVACQQPDDVMKGGGGDIDPAQQTADTIEALKVGDASVCADSMVHMTVLSIIHENLDDVIRSAPMSEVYEREAKSVLSERDSLVRGFDPATKSMRCESKMVTLMQGETYETPVFWSVQPTADGFDMNVEVEFGSFHDVRLPLNKALFDASTLNLPAREEPLYTGDAAAAPMPVAEAAPVPVTEPVAMQKPSKPVESAPAGPVASH